MKKYLFITLILFACKKEVQKPKESTNIINVECFSRSGNFRLKWRSHPQISHDTIITQSNFSFNYNSSLKFDENGNSLVVMETDCADSLYLKLSQGEKSCEAFASVNNNAHISIMLAPNQLK